MLFPLDIIRKIKHCAYYADRLTRTDLIEKYVVSENDYTSQFTSAFRREINALAQPGLSATIKLLDSSAERAVGADACVIFENGREIKVGIFEAKWPRLSTHVNCWDSKQKSTGRSHFDSQLSRQNLLHPEIAIWEMFYCEYPFKDQPSFMPDYVSACVWHDDAFNFSLSRTRSVQPWNDEELKTLLETCTVTIAEIIEEICCCHRGVPVPKGSEKKLFGDLGLPYSALIISYDREKASELTSPLSY
ncbi:hypothetical protein ACQKEF_21045 [Pseudomonas oryzihabitans]|uniref:hypothetical protein n=1 Tax=Pseudomonas oryzihabitans TaxID=47885 RepID=UPI00119CA18C|nr:hypothetical protein [Pseudomonas oryzihabitans]